MPKTHHIFQSLLPNCLSDYSWSIAQSWVADCLANHTGCLDNANSELPTRVLNIAGKHVYLEETRGLSGRYCALSYCWGVNQPFVTTLQNLEQNKKGIQIKQLPQTIQDAIKTTRKLGLEYLWVDALCIIQDSPEDWRAEAGRMRQVYTFAFITISALDASDSNEGFISSRPIISAKARKSREVRPAEVTIRWAFEKSPLFNRAWVLQERLLSTRTIHFGHEQMFWECNTLATTELSSHQYLRAGASEWYGQFFKYSLIDLIPASDADSQSVTKNIRIWDGIIERYSLCKMTKETDALPAISGIASEFARITGYTYLAGIWLEDLHSLLWYRKRGWQHGVDVPREAVTVYVAPSWSWAALGEAMEFYRTAAVVNRAIDACFVSHSLVPHGDNPFGQVKPKGSITLRGAMIAVQLRLQQKVQPQENSVEHAGKIMGNCAFPDIGDRVDGRTFWFLRMSKIDGGMMDGSLQVLVLLDMEDGSGTFKRVGTGNVNKDSAGFMEESAVREVQIV